MRIVASPASRLRARRDTARVISRGASREGRGSRGSSATSHASRARRRCLSLLPTCRSVRPAADVLGERQVMPASGRDRPRRREPGAGTGAADGYRRRDRYGGWRRNRWRVQAGMIDGERLPGDRGVVRGERGQVYPGQELLRAQVLRPDDDPGLLDTVCPVVVGESWSRPPR